MSTEDNVKLSKLLSEGFKRRVYWNEYKLIVEISHDANNSIRKTTDSSCQGITGHLFLLMKVVLIELQLIFTEDTFFQEQKLKITTLKLTEEFL